MSLIQSRLEVIHLLLNELKTIVNAVRAKYQYHIQRNENALAAEQIFLLESLTNAQYLKEK